MYFIILLSFLQYYNNKGPFIKDVRTQEGRGFVQCGHFSDKGKGISSDADARTF